MYEQRGCLWYDCCAIQMPHVLAEIRAIVTKDLAGDVVRCITQQRHDKGCDLIRTRKVTVRFGRVELSHRREGKWRDSVDPDPVLLSLECPVVCHGGDGALGCAVRTHSEDPEL